jgi:hypothetical protein
MNKECQGCYLYRTLFYEPLNDPPELENITCEYEKLKCPCKTCLVKITCNIIDGGACKEFIEFTVEHRKDQICLSDTKS